MSFLWLYFLSFNVKSWSGKVSICFGQKKKSAAFILFNSCTLITRLSSQWTDEVTRVRTVTGGLSSMDRSGSDLPDEPRRTSSTTLSLSGNKEKTERGKRLFSIVFKWFYKHDESCTLLSVTFCSGFFVKWAKNDFILLLLYEICCRVIGNEQIYRDS